MQEILRPALARPESVPQPLARIGRRPFDHCRDLIYVSPGDSVFDVVLREFPDRREHPFLIVALNGDSIPSIWWRHVRPKPGSLIEISILPRGGGSLRTILALSVMVAATAFAGPLGTALAGSAFGAAVGLSATVATGLITAGLGTIGMLAVNALVPPEQPRLNDGSRSSPHYALEGARNRSLQFGSPVPINLGRNRVFPYLGATSVPESVGGDQFLRMLLVWSEGENQVSGQRIGETPITDFDDLETEFDDGADESDSTWTLYPSDIHSLSVNADLTSADGAVTRRTAAGITQIVVDIFFPAGLLFIGKKTGDRDGYTVDIKLETSPAEADTWTTHEVISTRRKTATPFFVSRTLDLDEGQYDVRLTRITPDDDRQNVADDAKWSLLKSVATNQQPIRMKSVCGTAIRIRASGQTNGVIDQWNGVLESICLDWDADTQAWVKRATRNPASLFRRFLQGPWRQRPVPDGKIDLGALQDWHEFCDAKGLTCDIYVDWSATASEVLNLIAACGLATWGKPDSLYTVSIDRAKARTQIFTPRNSRGFSAVKAFARPVHALRGKFKNEEQDYRQDSVIIPAPGYTEETARFIDEIDLMGVTSPQMAWLMTSRRLAERLLRSTQMELTAGWESIRSVKGDRVGIAATSILAGAGSGRVVSATDDGANVSAFTLDARLEMTAGLAYSAVIRHSDGQISTAGVETTVGRSDTVTLRVPLPIADGPQVGDLIAIGVENREMYDCLIKGIVRANRAEATLSLIPYAPEVFDAENGIPDEIPSYINTPPSYGAPSIAAIRSGEAAAIISPDGGVQLRAFVSVSSSGSRPVTVLQSIEIRWRAQGDDSPWRIVTMAADDTVAVITDVQHGDILEVQARWLFRNGSTSPWSSIVEHEVEGPSLPPPDPTTAYQDGDIMRWTGDLAYDHAGWMIRTSESVGAGWKLATPLFESPYTANLVSIDLFPSTAKEFLVKAISKSGLQSENAATSPINLAVLPGLYTLSSVDKRDSGWLGTRSGNEIISGDLVGISSSSMWPDPAAAAWPDTADAAFDTAWDEFVYETTWSVPTNALLSDQVALSWVASAGARVEVRWSTDSLIVLVDADIVSEYIVDADAVEFDDSAPPFAFPDGESARPWVPYRSAFQPVPNDVLRIRVIIPGGSGAQPYLEHLVISLKARGITETYQDVTVGIDGVYLTPTQTMRKIILANGQAVGSGGAVVFRTLEKSDPAKGALVQAVDVADQPIPVIADLFQTGV